MALDFHGLDLQIQHHQAALEALPDKFVEGRNLREGYLRGLGLQFGNLAQFCSKDPIFVEAYSKAKRFASPVGDLQLCNFYLLLKYFLPAGNIVEFGVDRGGSLLFLSHLAQEYRPGSLVYGFDSFEGMPATSSNDVHKEGDFNGASETEILSFLHEHHIVNVRLIKGFFSSTLSYLKGLPSFSLAHIDCDLYQAVRDTYCEVRHHMVPQGYIVFDDAWACSCIGAFDAVTEYVTGQDGKKAEQTWPHLVFRA